MSCGYVRKPNFTDSNRYALQQASEFFDDLPQARTWQQRRAVLWQYGSRAALDYVFTALLAPKQWQCR